MFNYLEETIRNIEEAIENRDYDYIIENKSYSEEEKKERLYDDMWCDDSITGNGIWSYYCNSYKARKQCYNYSNDVEIALEEYGYKTELEKFKIFDYLVQEGWLNIEDMQLDTELIEEMLNQDQQAYIYCDFEIMQDLNFEAIDVITRCYYLSSALCDVLELKDR